MSFGFTDKLYWRPMGNGVWHCFKKKAHADGGGYASLCQRAERDRAGGQAITRPPAVLRCGRCDGLEMDRRKWNESGRETVSLDEASSLYR